MFVNLTYPLGPDTPTYRENPPVEVRPFTRIEDGDAANTLELRTVNHNGTHLDAPYHFDPEGKRLTDLDLAEFVFDAPVLVEIPKSDGELITPEDLERVEPVLAGADLLLVRTGWAAACRRDDPKRYGLRAPGFAAAAGRFLLERSAVRAVAMDMPSATSPVEGPPRDEGREFHRIVLGSEGRTLLLIEDVHVDALGGERPARVIAAPLWLQDADGAPVTMLAETRLSETRT